MFKTYVFVFPLFIFSPLAAQAKCGALNIYCVKIKTGEIDRSQEIIKNMSFKAKILDRRALRQVEKLNLSLGDEVTVLSSMELFNKAKIRTGKDSVIMVEEVCNDVNPGSSDKVANLINENCELKAKKQP